MSGVKANNECVDAFNDFKLGKKFQYVLFGFNKDQTQIVVLHKEPRCDTDKNGDGKAVNPLWTKLIQMLPGNDVRYVIADINYNTLEGVRTEMVFIAWAPDTAPIRKKMLITSSQNALKSVLVGVHNTVQACFYPDIEIKSVAEKLKGAVATEN